MRVTSVDISGVLLIEPKVVRDHRGCYVETPHEQRYREAGMTERFVQHNYSRSVRDTLRGLHVQEPHAQGNLVMAVEGVVWTCSVKKDFEGRNKSLANEPTFGRVRALLVRPGSRRSRRDLRNDDQNIRRND